jgi:Flp pilus assembly protein TadD
MLKGCVAEALAVFRQAAEIAPGNPRFLNDLAWLLATGPVAALRDGPRALELARQASELTGGKNPFFLHTLAAAWAETGRFDEAARCAQAAVALAETSGQHDLTSHLQAELKRYQAGLALHD